MASTCCCCCSCRYLIEHGANVGAVNSEGELPLDVATEDAMERLLKGEIKKQGEALLFVCCLQGLLGNLGVNFVLFLLLRNRCG